ncbi:DNA/RNA non-specific endonuclease [uncultured Sphingomonas sp.]|uniref:DNA/RNA non-specific endonuclease n=1 Tax=uncultured Sphingomonas sp. TaxID=158754 RepID=UPI00262CE7B2|nr:DNA/RNA non-specific endonuclease [uncultured Sphingomonas sp.]
MKITTCVALVLAASTGCALFSPVGAATRCPQHFANGAEPKLINPKLAVSATELCNSRFATLSSGVTRTPLFAAEHLTRASVAAAREYDQRDNRFHADTRLGTADRARLDDYAGSGFDRGHMAPSGDMTDATSDYESFSLANMVPQAGGLNRNSWADLENYVRRLTTTLGDTYVVTGPLYEGSRLKTLNGRVLVPTSTWKALYAPGQGAGAWIATNTAAPRWQVVSIAELTRRTGIDPFPRLAAATKAKVPAFPNFGREGAKRDR